MDDIDLHYDRVAALCGRYLAETFGWPTMTIHEIRARTTHELDASARRATPTCSVDVPRCRVVERDPATTPDPADEARWAAQRPARRVAMRGEG